jgi:hypothetical protein
MTGFGYPTLGDSFDSLHTGKAYGRKHGGATAAALTVAVGDMGIAYLMPRRVSGQCHQD